MPTSACDAIVIGSGPNGMVAANRLADAGWSVLVLEAAPEPGGAVRSGELTLPGFVHDRFSSFYPMALASTAIAGLRLEDHGLRWAFAPEVLAHPFVDGRCATLSTSAATTRASLDAFAPGDGAAMVEMLEQWQRLQPALANALLGPFPPVSAALRMGAKLRSELLDFVRFTLLPLRRLAAERFNGEGAPLLLAGSSSHSALAPEAVMSSFLGWLLVGLGHEHGFPVPVGGAGELITAMQRRLETLGGTVRCGSRVERVVVERGRAVGVVVDGTEIRAGRAVLADVGAPQLYTRLVGAQHLSPSFLSRLSRFEQDPATVKLDWALDRPVPWTAADASRGGTVHIGRSLDHYTRAAASIATGHVPAEPVLVMGQMTTTDASRSPEGTETLWAYWRLPQTIVGDDVGSDMGGADTSTAGRAGPAGAAGPAITGRWDDADRAAVTERIEAMIEDYAPGFRNTIIARHLATPPEFEATDANLVGGAIGGGSSELHQQLVFRPVPGINPATTPIKRLYLASASAHPGGGVHGACGANAAHAALRNARFRR